MLKLENINKSYTIRKDLKQEVLVDLDVEFPSSGFISIVGNSGSGKTTLLNIIGGLDHVDSGTVTYNNNPIEDYDKYRRENVGVVFQEYNLIDHLNIVDNVILSMSDDCSNKKKEAKKILNDLGLEGCYHKKPKQLSGGQQQRVAIARMIAMDVDIFICDEPTGSLDKKTSANIVKLLKKLSQDKLIIFVTHNLEIAKEYSDEILEIEEGKIRESKTYEVSSIIEKVEKHRGYHGNVKWLAFKNLVGRYKKTIKYILITAFIMLISALSIIMDSEVFNEYIHEYYLDQGIKNVVVYLDRYSIKDGFISDLEMMDNVNHIALDYDSLVRFSSTDLEKNRTPEGSINSKVKIENVTNNDYFKEIVTDGRFPEASDEILMSPEGAIIVLRDLKIGGDRLYDQFMTGKVTSEYVFSLVDDRVFIITESGYPRVRIVGLVDDKRIQEERQTVYFVDGFTDLFSYRFGLRADRLKIYKDILYKEENTELSKSLEAYDGILIDEMHQWNTDRIYNKISSLLDLSKLGLMVIIVIASISYISLISSSILERKYEIGLYRTTGYNNKNTSRILGFEMFIVNTSSIFIVILSLLFIVKYATMKLYSISNFNEVLSKINVAGIVSLEILILLFFTVTTLYFTYKKILKETIISNVKK